MEKSHIPTRMCVVCMNMKPKDQMIRLTKNKFGNIVVDYKQKLGGRGVWIDLSNECISLLKKRKSLERKFKCAIPNEIYEEISKYLNERK